VAEREDGAEHVMGWCVDGREDERMIERNLMLYSTSIANTLILIPQPFPA